MRVVNNDVLFEPQSAFSGPAHVGRPRHDPSCGRRSRHDLMHRRARELPRTPGDPALAHRPDRQGEGDRWPVPAHLPSPGADRLSRRGLWHEVLPPEWRTGEGPTLRVDRGRGDPARRTRRSRLGGNVNFKALAREFVERCRRWLGDPDAEINLPSLVSTFEETRRVRQALDRASS